MPQPHQEEEEENPTLEASEEPEAVDNTIVKVLCPMSKATWRKISELAIKRETSKAGIIREAVKRYVVELEAEQTLIKVSDRKLDLILKENTVESTQGFFSSTPPKFNIEGFIDAMEDKGFRLKDLSPDQWRKVKTQINMGHFPKLKDGRADFEGLAEMFKDLEPSKEQYEWLSTDTSEEGS